MSVKYELVLLFFPQAYLMYTRREFKTIKMLTSGIATVCHECIAIVGLRILALGIATVCHENI